MYREGPANFHLGRTPIHINFTAKRENNTVLEVVSVDDPVEGAAILLRPLHPVFSGLPYLGGRAVWRPSEEDRTFMALLGEAAFYFSLLTHRLPVKSSLTVPNGVRVTLQHVYRRPSSTALETREILPKASRSDHQVYSVKQGAVYGLELYNFHLHSLHVIVLVFNTELQIRMCGLRRSHIELTRKPRRGVSLYCTTREGRQSRASARTRTPRG